MHRSGFRYWNLKAFGGFKFWNLKALGCQILGFKSLCWKSSRRLKTFSGNPSGEAGAHNKIPALDCIKIPKRKISPPCSGLSKDPTNIYIYKDKNGDKEDEGSYKFSMKRQDCNQITPLQYSIHRSSISKDVIQELEATFDRTSFQMMMGIITSILFTRLWIATFPPGTGSKIWQRIKMMLLLAWMWKTKFNWSTASRIWGEQGHDQKIKSLGLLEWNNKAFVLN